MEWPEYKFRIVEDGVYKEYKSSTSNNNKEKNKIAGKIMVLILSTISFFLLWVGIIWVSFFLISFVAAFLESDSLYVVLMAFGYVLAPIISFMFSLRIFKNLTS